MATQHVKVYEEKKKGIPVWAWLLPLLLIAALLAWFLLRPKAEPATTAAAPAPTPVAAAPATMPDLGTVHFATDQATLTPEGQATLTRAAEFMKQNPSSHLRIEGFTDSTGTDPHNANLSEQRALTVGHFLEGQGIDKSRLTGGGFASSNPADTNATAAGKADNRRVELFQQQ